MVWNYQNAHCSLRKITVKLFIVNLFSNLFIYCVIYCNFRHSFVPCFVSRMCSWRVQSCLQTAAVQGRFHGVPRTTAAAAAAAAAAYCRWSHHWAGRSQLPWQRDDAVRLQLLGGAGALSARSRLRSVPLPLLPPAVSVRPCDINTTMRLLSAFRKSIKTYTATTTASTILRPL